MRKLYIKLLVAIILLTVTAVSNILQNCDKAGKISNDQISSSGESFETTKNVENDTDDITDSEFYIRYLDVGNADCALVCCNGKYLLIDGGNVDDSSLVVSVLKSSNIEHLDYMICTHAHEDHVGGLAGALNAVSVGQVLCSVDQYDSTAFNNFAKYTHAQGLDITIPETGDIYYLGDARAIILGPSKKFSETNNQSLIVKIYYKNTSFLFMGDAETEAETHMLDSMIDVSCDVLKVGHHGSSSSSGYRFIRESAPKYAVISVGKNNQYGHPHAETLSRFSDAGTTVYRTDISGDITAYSDGENISFSFEKSDSNTAEHVRLSTSNFNDQIAFFSSPIFRRENLQIAA